MSVKGGGVSGYVGAGRDGCAEQKYGSSGWSARAVRLNTDVAFLYLTS